MARRTTRKTNRTQKRNKRNTRTTKTPRYQRNRSNRNRTNQPTGDWWGPTGQQKTKVMNAYTTLGTVLADLPQNYSPQQSRKVANCVNTLTMTYGKPFANGVKKGIQKTWGTKNKKYLPDTAKACLTEIDKATKKITKYKK